MLTAALLFWQFNDCCPAVSWSCIDYVGRPKALYYYAKRFFSPVITTVSAQYDLSQMPLKKTISFSDGFDNKSFDRAFDRFFYLPSV